MKAMQDLTQHIAEHQSTAGVENKVRGITGEGVEIIENEYCRESAL